MRSTSWSPLLGLVPCRPRAHRVREPELIAPRIEGRARDAAPAKGVQRFGERDVRHQRRQRPVEKDLVAARGEAFGKYVNQKYGAQHKTVIVPLCGHNARCMFTADSALPVLFPKQ